MNGASREGLCWEGVSQAEVKVCTEALSEWTEAQWGLSISKEAGVGGAEGGQSDPRGPGDRKVMGGLRPRPVTKTVYRIRNGGGRGRHGPSGLESSRKT